MAQQTHDAWREVRKIQTEYSGFYKLSGGLLLVLLGVLIGAGLFHNDEGYWGNILSEVIGISFAVFVLDQRAEQRRIKDLQERLVMEAGSQSNETARQAIYELERRGWLKGEKGLLQGKYLEHANLREVSLREASLQGTDLYRAKLQNANLRVANLQGANLRSARMQEVKLSSANLQGADLSFANLQGARLRAANLQGAILEHVNLLDAYLVAATFDENTILPDSTRWTPHTDMTRFTDPNHPNFWRWLDPETPT